MHFMLCSSYYWTCLKCVSMWIFWTSKEQGRKTPKLDLSSIWFLVSVCFHDAKVVVVVGKLFLQQRFYFCKVVVASIFLLCRNSCCNCWIITFVTFAGLPTMWFEKQKLKFYCNASIVARLLLFWSFYYYFEVSIPLKLFIAIYKLSFQGPTLQWWNLLWLPCATIILAFDGPCNNENTTQQEVNKRWREILQHNLMKVQGQEIMKCNIISI